MIMQHWLFQWRCSISGEENIFISWNMCWKLYFPEISIENYSHKASIKKKGKKKAQENQDLKTSWEEMSCELSFIACMKSRI